MTFNTPNSGLGATIDAPYKPLTKKEVRALGEEVVASVRDGSGGYLDLPSSGINIQEAPEVSRSSEDVQRRYREGLRFIFGP